MSMNRVTVTVTVTLMIAMVCGPSVILPDLPQGIVSFENEMNIDCLDGPQCAELVERPVIASRTDTDFAGKHYSYIAGHRYVEATECPGDNLYNLLPTIRQYVASNLQTKSTITVGTTSYVETCIDPAKSYDYFGWMIISALSSGLVEIIPGSDAGVDNIKGALAESWTIDTTGTIWDFNLKHDLTFFDGYPFNASVVKYSFDRNCNLTGDGLYELDGPQFNMGYGDIIKNVTVTGTYSLRFYLKLPFAPFLQLMSCAASVIVHPRFAPLDDYIRYTTADARASHPCGLGPFTLTKWVRYGASDVELHLEKNPQYWNASLPETDRIIIKFYQTETSLASAISSKEIDVAYRHLTRSQVNTFRHNPDFTVWEGLSPQIHYLCFQQSIYPLNETRIRQGIGAALNRSHVTEIVFENTVDPLYSIIPKGLAYHKPSFQKYGSANYTYTQDCLNEYGYNSTNKLVLDLYYESSGHYPSSAEQAAVYKNDLEASGVITVNLFGLDWGSYKSARNAGTMPLFLYGWYADYVDADNYARLPFDSWLNIGYNKTYPQGGVDQYNLWVDGRSAISDAGRRVAYESLEDLQADECSLVPLWQGHLIAVSTKSIHDIVFDITANWYFSLLTTEDYVARFTLSQGWDTKELFVPIYYRSPENSGSVVLGICNRRDMWYLVRFYTRQSGQPWNEINPWSFPYIAPWCEKTFLYTPQAGEEIKIEVLNDLNDDMLAAIWTADFVTRAIVGVSISPYIPNVVEFIAKLSTFYNRYMQLGSYIAAALLTGDFEPVILKMLEIVVSSTAARDAILNLLWHIGINIGVAKFLALVSSTAVRFIVKVPIWLDFIKNTNREPFIEDVVFATEFIDQPSSPDLTITQGFTVVQDGPYYVGETINARFRLTNKGTASATISVLTVGGRGPSGDEDVQDFTFATDITLAPSQSYDYEGELKLLRNGSYHFSIAYQTQDGIWITSVPTELGCSNTLDIEVLPIPDRWIGGGAGSPCELRVYDSEDRVTGLVNEEERNEIPNSICCGNTIVILQPVDSYRYQIVGIGEGFHNLTLVRVESDDTTTFYAENIPVSAEMVHQYTIDWSALSEGGDGVTLCIDSEGDGEFETVIYADSELTQTEYFDAISGMTETTTTKSTTTTTTGATGGELLDEDDFVVMLLLSVIVVLILAFALQKRRR